MYELSAQRIRIRISTGGTTIMLRLTIVLASLTAAAFAQVLPVGTIDGNVHDSTGAAVPGMTITLTHLDTNQVRTATTNDSGYYFFPLANPGRYQVMAEKIGFKRSTQEVLVETGK